MGKKIIKFLDIIGAIIGISAVIVFGLDYFFHTNIGPTIAENSSILSALLNISQEEPEYEPVNLEDPFYIALSEYRDQIMEPETVQTMKVQTISDSEKKFEITDYSGVLVQVIVSQSGTDFIIQKSQISK